MVVAIALVSCFFLAFIPVDFAQNNISEPMRAAILGIRFFIAGTGLFYCLYIFRKPTLAIQDLGGSIFAFIMYTGFALRTLFANFDDAYEPKIGVSGFLLILGAYLFVTLPLRHMTLSALYGMVAFVSVGAYLLDLSSTTFINLVLWSSIVNLLGWITARRIHRLRRMEYANIIRVSEVNMMLIHEVAERRQAEESAKQAKEEAVIADQAKSRFLAAASHDLRQPLHAMGMFVSALATLVKDEKSKTLVEKLEASVETTNELFEAILDISKLDAGAVAPRTVVFHVGSIFDRAANFLGGPAKKKGLALTFVGGSLVAKSDPVMLERVINNLGTNAIRYTNEGRVLIGIRKRGDKLRLEVHDTGIGIQEIELDKIFKEFEQLDSKERNRQQGLGLGLSISRRLAHLLGSDISVRSQFGKGSVFSMELPLGKEADLPEKKAGGTASAGNLLPGARVLVIDDDLEVRDGMEALLDLWRCEVIGAASTEDAIKAVSDGVRQPDAIIADYRLGNGQTGVDAIARLRAVIGAPIPAMVVTGDASRDVLEEIRQEGYQPLHKPLRPDRLKAALEGVIESGRA